MIFRTSNSTARLYLVCRTFGCSLDRARSGKHRAQSGQSGLSSHVEVAWACRIFGVLPGLCTTLFVGLLAPASVSNAESHPPVRLGMIESPLHRKADLQPVADWIAARTSRVVELVTVDDYPELSARIESGAVEIAILFPVALAQSLEKLPPVRVLACSVRQGKPTYRGYFITRHRSDVRTLADLAGKRIAFVDESSTSGFFFPFQVLRKEGFVKERADLERFFGSVSFLGSHEKVLQAVASGDADVGTVYDQAIRRSVDMGVDAATFRILGRTDPIPHEAVAAAPGLDPALFRELQEAILALDTRTEEGRRVLLPMAMELNGFAPCDERVFDPVRELIE